MKTITHNARSKDKMLHIETEGGIVNIKVGLTDRENRPVTSIEVIPDLYVGENWHRDGYGNTRLIRQYPEDKPIPEPTLTAAVLTEPQQETVRFFQGYNVPAQWFVGVRQADGAVEVVALGERFCWSFVIQENGSYASSEGTLGEFSTGIEV